MNIYIDESGSFVSSPQAGAWNVVAAATTTEADRSKCEKIIKSLKLGLGKNLNDEIKLYELTEQQYIAFLKEISQTRTLCFATATDAGLNSIDEIHNHQSIQVQKIRQNIPLMKYEGGRQGLELLASMLESIPPQLYVQLVCQVALLHEIIKRAVNYYAQRSPATLRELRWKIDQKNTSKTVYETAFERIAPPLLQSKSLRDPLFRVNEFDYSHFKQYEFPNGELPDYLETEYGIKVENAVNVQKLIRGNLKFMDSKQSTGIQIADLFASGLRKCLRKEFSDNMAVASVLGKVMLQNIHNKQPIDLVSFSDAYNLVDRETSSLVKIMAKNSRAMLK